MSTQSPADAHSRLETLFEQGTLSGMTDGELLARFAAEAGAGAETAFAVLVERHAPMVLRVCQAVLATRHDAEDASQAVFLVLARRAQTVRQQDSAASWLYGVARRVAARARRDNARRHKHEQRRAAMVARRIDAAVVWNDHGELYDEIDRLPEIYRSAFVLCYLEGLSHEQAAQSLSCPLRTLQSRLLRAKERLRQRMTRYGAILPAALPASAHTSIPSAAWLKSTAEAATAFAAGHTPVTIAGVSAATLTLARSSARAAIPIPKLVAGVLMLASLAAVVVAVGRLGPEQPPNAVKASEPGAAAQPAKDRNNRTIVIRVLDRNTKLPIDGADVSVEIDSGARAGLGGEPELIARPTTDREGKCTITFPRILPQEIYITARKSGYANRAYGPLLEAAGPAIPGDHTIEMDHGVTIGGIVKSQGGKPVADATVIIMARAGADGAADWTYIPNVQVTTDSQGRWRYSQMPPGWSRVHLNVTHPDYVPTFMQRAFPMPGDLLLKAKKSEMILDEGIALTGRVVDDRGRPIAGAHIGLGADRRFAQRDYPSAATDAMGVFRFRHVPAGTQTLTAQAPGRAPELADVVVAPGMKPVEFRLGPGHIIRGRVVDPQGQPLEGATVQAMDWNRHWSLDWTNKTDALGRFTWNSAPAEPVALTLTRPGYTMVGQREFRADGAETIVTMYPPLVVQGKVTDIRTGKPIDRFTIVHGNYYRSSNQDGVLTNVDWERLGPRNDFSSGAYEVEYSHPQVMAVSVRVEANGYKPATSPPFKMEAGTVVFDARLEPGIGPAGMVQGRDGRPLAGATVIVSTKSKPAQFYNSAFHEGAYPQVVTGSDGRFSFSPQSEPFGLFVDHATGFAEADEKALANSSSLTIQPWGRIEGIVKIGSRLAAGVQVYLSEIDGSWNPDEAASITQAQQKLTDAHGRYVFERIIPARLAVSRVFTLERSSFHVGNGAFRIVTVRPDLTTVVDLGGTGRPVVGRFVFPGGVKASAVFPRYNQTLERIVPEPPFPPILGGNDREAWLTRWLATDQGEAYSSLKCTLDTNVRPDGHFRIDDVSAGRYRLHAEVNEPGNSGFLSYGTTLAGIDIEITVPEIPGGRSDVPLDVGTIELKPLKPADR